MTHPSLESAVAETPPATVAIIIVAYASGAVLGACLEAVLNQTRRPDLIVVVDNNSPDPSYLDRLPRDPSIRLLRNSVNEGFCGANNRGYLLAREHKYVVFLNPDAFPQEDLIERSVEWMEAASHQDVGIMTGTLLKFDVTQNRPTGTVDSAGVFQTWYGKWYERQQGTTWLETTDRTASNEIVAVCGALMFCRTQALENSLTPAGDVFDRDFFMYKEDIDLSLRVHSRGWRLIHVPTILCYHCRGWQSREKMSKRARYISAKNELKVCFRNHGKGLLYSILKYAYVPVEEWVIRLTHSLDRLRRA